MRSKERIQQLILKLSKYVLGGGTAALLDLTIRYLLTEKLGLHYLSSIICSFVIAFIYGFLFQKYITFKHKQGKFHKQIGLFFLFQIIGLGIDAGLSRIFVEHFHFYFMYVSVFNKGLIFLRNFTMNYFFNFKE